MSVFGRLLLVRNSQIRDPEHPLVMTVPRPSTFLQHSHNPFIHLNQLEVAFGLGWNIVYLSQTMSPRWGRKSMARPHGTRCIRSRPGSCLRRPDGSWASCVPARAPGCVEAPCSVEPAPRGRSFRDTRACERLTSRRVPPAFPWAGRFHRPGRCGSGRMRQAGHTPRERGQTPTTAKAGVLSGL